MTETASGPARSSRAKGTKATKGLRIERIHTTPGVHPYDEVAWERRDVVMTNWRDGSVNFEQRGVEFNQLHLGLLVTGDAGARDANVKAGLGGRVFVLETDGPDGGGLALGGMVDAPLPSRTRVAIDAICITLPDLDHTAGFRLPTGVHHPP